MHADCPLIKTDGFKDSINTEILLSAGECLGISGPSGSGKTRLLRALADLDPHQGEIFLSARACTEIPAPEWRKQVAYLQAEPQWWLSVLGAHCPQTNESQLRALNLQAEILKRDPADISTGERQRFALLRILANKPRVLLLDEPTSALDERNTLAVETLVSDYLHQQQAAAIWVSHDLEQLKRVADKHLTLTTDAPKTNSPAL